MDCAKLELSVEEETVVVTVAYLEVTRRRATSKISPIQDSMIWRFSSRWWTPPVSVTRPKPGRR